MCPIYVGNLSPFQIQLLLIDVNRALNSLEMITNAGWKFDVSRLQKLKAELEMLVEHDQPEVELPS